MGKMDFILQQLNGFTWGEWVLLVIGILFIIALFVGLYRIIEIQEMSDKDREKYGFGPRGQGKGW
jgi:phosphotransferase system  glucose/maltose/N-acetylglucosamine-specific IIC component